MFNTNILKQAAQSALPFIHEHHISTGRSRGGKRGEGAWLMQKCKPIIGAWEHRTQGKQGAKTPKQNFATMCRISAQICNVFNISVILFIIISLCLSQPCVQLEGATA